MDYIKSFDKIQTYLDNLTRPLQARKITSLNLDWKFLAGEVPAQGESFDDSNWRQLDIPHDWSIEGEFSNRHPSSGSGGWVQTGVVWYRKKFALIDHELGRKLFILFDGVSMNSNVWVNGHFLGNHAYGFTPFWYDITPWVKIGENVLAVKADTSLVPYSRFYHGTGIYRPVWLISTNALHIEQWGVAAVTEASGEDSATVAVTTKVRVAAYPETKWFGFGAEPQQEVTKACTLETTIVDGDGRDVVTSTVTANVANYSSPVFKQTLTVPQPKLWSADSPAMYSIRSQLIADGEIVDETLTPLGIRQISWGAGFGFAINGTPVKLKGVCLHQDSGPWGGAVPMKAWVRKLMTLKELGCNAVRTAHHPFPAEFYHCCDVLGMMVMDESFDEWKRGWDRDSLEQPTGKNGYGYSLYFDQWSDCDMRAMLRRDRNHPSVVMWSIGNEIPELYFAESVEIVRRLAGICREEDPSRPVTIGAEGQYRLPLHEGFMDLLDIAGYNYVNLRHPVKYYEDLHAEHPDWVMLGTETFYDPGHIPAISKHPYSTGQFLWVGYDYLGEAYDPTEMTDPATGAKRLHHGSTGIVDVLDTPRAEYWYRQSLWAEKPVVHMAVKTGEWVREWWNQIPAASHWNWNDGDTKTVYCFTNCEEVELLLNGVSLGRRQKNLGDPLPLEWDVEFHPGTVELVGYHGSRQVCSHQMETTGSPCRLALTCDSAALQAGYTDAAHVEISIVDRDGRVVPTATARVTVHASGAGQVLATANGDMSDADGYRRNDCLTVNGRCMAVIAAARDAGVVTITAHAEGLEQVEMEIEVRI